MLSPIEDVLERVPHVSDMILGSLDMTSLLAFRAASRTTRHLTDEHTEHFIRSHMRTVALPSEYDYDYDDVSGSAPTPPPTPPSTPPPSPPPSIYSEMLPVHAAQAGALPTPPPSPPGVASSPPTLHPGQALDSAPGLEAGPLGRPGPAVLLREYATGLAWGLPGSRGALERMGVFSGGMLLYRTLAQPEFVPGPGPHEFGVIPPLCCNLLPGSILSVIVTYETPCVFDYIQFEVNDRLHSSAVLEVGCDSAVQLQAVEQRAVQRHADEHHVASMCVTRERTGPTRTHRLAFLWAEGPPDSVVVRTTHARIVRLEVLVR